jgi:hypothetical protein
MGDLPLISTFAFLTITSLRFFGEAARESGFHSDPIQVRVREDVVNFGKFFEFFLTEFVAGTAAR